MIAINNLTIFDKFDIFCQIWQFGQFLTIFYFFDTFEISTNVCNFDNCKNIILETCDIYDTDYIIVTWQLRMTVDSIGNSCNVLL